MAGGTQAIWFAGPWVYGLSGLSSHFANMYIEWKSIPSLKLPRICAL